MKESQWISCGQPEWTMEMDKANSTFLESAASSIDFFKWVLMTLGIDHLKIFICKINALNKVQFPKE